MNSPQGARQNSGANAASNVATDIGPVDLDDWTARVEPAGLKRLAVPKKFGGFLH